MPGLWWLFAFAAGFLAVLWWRWSKGRREPGYLAVSEYWVYAVGASLPRIERIMEAMVKSNPLSRPDRPAITTREGVLFSDLRLRMSAARRDGNPHAFRPDLFEEDAVPSAAILHRLSQADVFLRLRYLSEARLSDTRHLQFMPHLAAAVCRLVDGTIVYDPVSQVLYTHEEFVQQLRAHPDAEAPEIHVRTVRKESPDGVWYESRGLRKVGRKELRSDFQDPDSDVLVEHLLRETCLRLFREPDSDGPFDIQAFGGRFLTEIEPQRGETHMLRLGRVRDPR